MSSSDGLHPDAVMRRPSRDRPCGRKDKHVEVEDHGNGFMFIGCSDIEQAKRLLRDYLPKKVAKGYVFAARTQRDAKVCCVWLAPTPLDVWEGATFPDGTAMPRYPGGPEPD